MFRSLDNLLNLTFFSFVVWFDFFFSYTIEKRRIFAECRMVFTTEGFLEVTIESWPEKPADPTDLLGHDFN